jgi:hypothetical protein
MLFCDIWFIANRCCVSIHWPVNFLTWINDLTTITHSERLSRFSLSLFSYLFSPGTPVSSTNKTGLHDIIEILLKVALNTITLTPFKRPVCSNHLVSVYYTYCNQNFSARRKPPTCQVTDKLYHTMMHRVHLAWAGFELTTLVVIGTDCIGRCKSNYYTINTTMSPTEQPF